MCFWKELKYAAVNSFLLTPHRQHLKGDEDGDEDGQWSP